MSWNQGSKLEDGIPGADPKPPYDPDESRLSWIDQGAPCKGCGIFPEFRTELRRELILEHPDPEAFIEGEREKGRRAMKELAGDLCPACAKKAPANG